MKSKKVRRVSEVNTKRINKRKYYGVKTEIDEMKEALEYHFTHTSVIDNLEDSLVSVDTQSEDYAEEVAAGTTFLREDSDAVLKDVEEPLSNSYKKGTRRAFNAQGDTLPQPDNIDAQVNDILQEQKNYISKLDNDLQQKAEQIIRQGLGQGLSKTEIVNRLREELKNLIDNRTSTISSTEAVAAAGAGTMATFKANGVSKVRWISSQDDRVCEPGNFRVTYNGKTYTSCQELHGETFELPGNHPVPVESTHPGDRCVLVSDE